jgi:hypothetical protein
MSEKNWYVQIIRKKDNKIVKEMGGMSEWKADKVTRGALLNLNCDEYYIDIVQKD